MTAGELLNRISSRELSEWLARERIEPLPDLNFLFARQMAVIATAYGGGKRYRAADFMICNRGGTTQTYDQAIAHLPGAKIAKRKER